ncbi:MAG: cytochrome P450 [Kaiparowitsia implicata GSE-PSE-MK54-09C]|jgi:cytochrome P450|nr:cytochrome P450 [Kaiparowitsia implicata GSE-PSE-MK54-09C]
MSYLVEYDSIPASDVSQRVGVVSRWIRTDARPFFAELRERRPIFFTPAFAFVTKYEDVLEVLSRDDIFSVRLCGSKMDESVGPFMLGRDRTTINYHDKSLMRLVLAQEDLPRVREMVSQLTEEAVAEASCEGRIELVKNVGRRVPVRLCGTYFGFPGPDEESMFRWSKATQTHFFKNLTDDPEIRQAAVRAGQELTAYLAGLVTARREVIATTSDTNRDVLTRLLMAQIPDGLGFEDDRLITNIAGLLVGSVETTSQAVVQALEQMLLHPGIRDRAIKAAKANDWAEFDGIVWEALRFNPINPLVFRYTETNTVLAEGTTREIEIVSGTIIFACTASAMWDSNFIANPDHFRVGRASHSYIHFGYAAHECLGKFVASVMIPEIVRVLFLHNVSLIDGAEGKIDFEGGPFPERFVVALEK